MKKGLSTICTILFLSMPIISHAGVTVNLSVTPSCQNDGAISCSASGGIAPYIYLWSNGSTSQNQIGLSTGSYCVTVTDNSGASATQCVNIGSLISVSRTVVNEVCPPGMNGEITVNASGGSSPYTYLWSDGNTLVHRTGLSGQQIADLHVTVTDANGCVGAFTDSQFVTPSFAYMINTDTPAICPSTTGLLSVYAFGGTPPYSYLWSNGATTEQITATVGIHYQVTVTDAHGCNAVKMPWQNTDTLMVNASFYVSCTGANEYCSNGLGTGIANVTGSGLAPFIYHWNTGQNTQTITGLHAGTYNVTVTDASGCNATGYRYVTNQSPVTVNISSVPEQCGNGTGSLTAVANGGIAPYTFTWSNGVLTQANTGLHLGSYQVTVRDANNCTSIGYGYVTNSSPIAQNATSANEVCSNHAGWAKVNPTLGTAPYTYIWSTGQTTSQINSLSAGSYYVTITDALGCTAYSPFYIQNTSPINANGTYVAPTCSNLNGSITLAPTGGTPPYTYLWNTIPPAFTSSVSGLGMGNYSCIITDANGCTRPYYVYLPYNSTLSAYTTSTDVVCPNTNGTASIVVSGGTLPYAYHWSNGSSSSSINGLSDGYYTVTVTDVSGCSLVKSAHVQSLSPLHITLSHTNADCIFDHNGTVTASVSGGTPPYSYHWQNGQTTATSSGLSPTWNYGVYITDVNNCHGHNWTNIGYNNTHCAVDLCGFVIADQNGNCIWDISEQGIPNVMIQAMPGSSTITDLTGHYSILSPVANYTIQQIIPPYFNQICPNPNPIINATVPDTMYCNNFYDHAIDTMDMRISWNYRTPPRPGFNTEVNVSCINDGINLVYDTMLFDYDPLFTFQSANVAPLFVDIPNHKVGFSMFNPNHASISNFTIQLSLPSSTALGTLVNCTAKAGNIQLIANDPTPLNNVETRSAEVVGSYDPNDKSVKPVGAGTHGIIQRSDSILSYTIRFQNTGTFMAENVVITDTLDSDLNITTIQGGASSHPYQMDFRGTNILLFKFLGINLSDSTTDEKASHGMVTFYIKQKKNLPDGTQFQNKAAIYFDYNAPIITNTTENTLVEYNGISETKENHLHLFPNPASSLLQIESDFNTVEKATVFDYMGRKCSEIELYPQITNKADVSRLPEGVYFVKLNSKSASASFIKITK